MKVLLTTLNAKYIHKNLALRWIYQARPKQIDATLKEFTIKDDLENVIQWIIQKNFDVVCFSVYIWNIEQTKQIIKRLKELQPHMSILVGGPEVSYESYDLLDQGVDAISIGEGEQSVWEYMMMLEAKQDYEISGIYTKSFPNTEYRKVDIAYLETLDNPYFMEMDQADMDRRYLYLETSRGCPYGCEYCLSSCDRQVRMFSEAYVMRLLEQIRQSNVKQVKLLDRTFNANPARALRIAKFMNEQCPKQIFQFEIVAETLSEELLTYFEKEADKQRFRFEIGVQSFHKETLKAVGRLQNNQRLKEVITRLKEADVIMHVDLIAGLPFEDFSTFQASFDELFSLGAKEVQLGILKLLKGTKLKQKGDLYEFTYEETSPYAIQSTKWLTMNELERIHDGAEAVEKFWNSGKCRKAISMILEQGWYTSAFALFLALGQQLKQLPRPYAPQQLFSLFYKVIEETHHEALTAMLFTDYYGLFKQRPPHFGGCIVPEDVRKQLQMFALEQGIDREVLFHYAFYTYAYEDGIAYQIVIYNAQQTLPKRYIVDAQIQHMREL